MPDLGSVLIVDDNCELAENLREILEDCGCIVDVAFNGADALRLLEHRPYRLVLTDMRMPGMEGHEMMAAMKSRWPGLPVAVMTAFANEANLLEVRRLGALHIFAKPLDLDALFNFIENALASERHVLVVEDDDCLRSNLVEILQQIDGVIPHPATTLHDAQRILENRPIKCAIVDIGLPDGDGASLVSAASSSLVSVGANSMPGSSSSLASGARVGPSIGAGSSSGGGLSSGGGGPNSATRLVCRAMKRPPITTVILSSLAVADHGSW